MELIILALLILGCIGVVITLIRRERARTNEATLRRDLHEADLHIQSEFHQARHRMNESAGQSWRNLAG